jgi:diacylglycerol kinase (ATP)
MRVSIILGLGVSKHYVDQFARNMDAAWHPGLPVGTGEADAIVIFGGDGTIHRHLAELARLQLPVLVVPCGSGNDFARALNLHRVRDSITAWLNFRSGRNNLRTIDLGVITPGGHRAESDVNGKNLSSGFCSRQKPADLMQPNKGTGITHAGEHYFCCVGGIGLDAEITRRANRLPRWIRSHGGYALSLLPALFAFRPFKVGLQPEPMQVRENQSAENSFQIGAPAQQDSSATFPIREHGQSLVVAFGNAPTYGDGLRIVPRAELDDGKLDVCVVSNMGKLRLLRLFPSLYSGGHLGIPEVEYFQTAFLRIQTEIPMEVYADGEYVCRTPVEISVQPKALKVIVPLPCVGRAPSPAAFDLE